MLKRSYIIITIGGCGIVIKLLTTTSSPINIAVLIYHSAICSTVFARLITASGIDLHEDVSLLYIPSLLSPPNTITY